MANLTNILNPDISPQRYSLSPNNPSPPASRVSEESDPPVDHLELESSNEDDLSPQSGDEIDELDEEAYGEDVEDGEDEIGEDEIEDDFEDQDDPPSPQDPVPSSSALPIVQIPAHDPNEDIKPGGGSDPNSSRQDDRKGHPVARRKVEKHDRKIDLGLHDHKAHADCPDTLACLPDTSGRPQHTLPVILRCAILGSPRKRLTIREIYATMESKYPYYKSAGQTWKQSVRHHLSLNRLFERQPRPVTDPGFGSYWTVNLTAPPGTKRPRKRGRPNKDGDGIKRTRPGRPAAGGIITRFQFQPQSHPPPPPPPLPHAQVHTLTPQSPAPTQYPVPLLQHSHHFVQFPIQGVSTPQHQNPHHQPYEAHARKPPSPRPIVPAIPAQHQPYGATTSQHYPQPQYQTYRQIPTHHLHGPSGQSSGSSSHISSYHHHGSQPQSRHSSQRVSPTPHLHRPQHYMQSTHSGDAHHRTNEHPRSDDTVRPHDHRLNDETYRDGYRRSPISHGRRMSPPPSTASSSRSAYPLGPPKSSARDSKSDSDHEKSEHNGRNRPIISDEEYDSEDDARHSKFRRNSHRTPGAPAAFIPTRPSPIFSLPPFSSIGQTREDMMEHMRQEIATLRRTSAEAVSTSIRLSEQLANANLEVSRSHEAVRDLEDMLQEETSKRKEIERQKEVEQDRRRAAEQTLSELQIPSRGSPTQTRARPT